MIDFDNLVVAPLMAVFGEVVQPTYTPVKAGGPAYLIDGVFDRAYRSVPQLDTVSAATTMKPVLGVRMSQFLSAPRADDLIFVAGQNATYVVSDVAPDGHGWALLELKKMRDGP